MLPRSGVGVCALVHTAPRAVVTAPCSRFTALAESRRIRCAGDRQCRLRLRRKAREDRR
jgi:hypothetical protein